MLGNQVSDRLSSAQSPRNDMPFVNVSFLCAHSHGIDSLECRLELQ